MASDSTGVGDRIRQARQAAGLSQAELAARVGLKQQSISQWEAGGTISTSALVDVAGALGVSTDELLGIASGSRRQRRWQASPTEEEIHIAASGADLEELRRLDPEAYDALIRQAEIALDRARDRRRRR